MIILMQIFYKLFILESQSYARNITKQKWTAEAAKTPQPQMHLEHFLVVYPSWTNKGGGKIAQLVASVCHAVHPGFAPGTIRFFQKGGMLSQWYWAVPTSADDWLKKGSPCVIMSV